MMITQATHVSVGDEVWEVRYRIRKQGAIGEWHDSYPVACIAETMQEALDMAREYYYQKGLECQFPVYCKHTDCKQTGKAPECTVIRQDEDK